MEEEDLKAALRLLPEKDLRLILEHGEDTLEAVALVRRRAEVAVVTAREREVAMEEALAKIGNVKLLLYCWSIFAFLFSVISTVVTAHWLFGIHELMLSPYNLAYMWVLAGVIISKWYALRTRVEKWGSTRIGVARKAFKSRMTSFSRPFYWNEDGTPISDGTVEISRLLGQSRPDCP